ncbi:MAG TPA: glycosyltransferase family 4 protein [Gaiellaceae bacterium]|nr:glycosyltransferase family 4 protein [Gaiellaceae bacterium]
MTLRSAGSEREGGRFRLAHVVSHPIAYFVPLYRELAHRSELELTVFYCSDATLEAHYDPNFERELEWDTPLLGGYEAVFLPSSRGKPVDAARSPNWDVVRETTSGRYDAVWVHAYGRATTWAVAAAGRLRGVPVLLREEATLLRRRGPLRRSLKELPLRLLFRTIWGGLYIGEENKRYLRRYGVPERRLFPVRYCVDNAYFRTAAESLRPRREEVRASFGIDDDAPVVLFCGNLASHKRPLELLEAFARVRQGTKCWLLLVGDGPLREALEHTVAADEIPGVILAGFRNFSEMTDAYAAADVFVLPSQRDTWGLVVNEAMNFGLPLVVSDRVGSGTDLVRTGVNGYVVRDDDVSGLSDALDALVRDAELRSRYGAASREIVAEYSVEAAADGIVAACRSIESRA